MALSEYSQRKFIDGSPFGAFYLTLMIGLERFAYYGFRTLLTVYMLECLEFNQQEIIVAYHVFCGIGYVFGGIGTVIGESKFGKLQLIGIVTFFYILGCVMLCMTSLQYFSDFWIKFIFYSSLFIIAFGHGTIYALVRILTVEQFESGNEIEQMHRFLVQHYLILIISNLMAKLIAPNLRSETLCFGYDCFLAAFVFHGIFLIIFFIAILSGVKKYILIKKENNEITNVLRLIWHGINEMLNKRSRDTYYYIGLKSEQIATGLKTFFKYSIFYLNLAIFWSLSNQHCSTWTLQASKMDSFLGPSISIKPEQMQSFYNVFLILQVIMIFGLVYPRIKCLSTKSYAVKICCGSFSTFGAFMSAWYLEKMIQSKKNTMISMYEHLRYSDDMFLNQEYSLSILWQLPQYFLISLGNLLVLGTTMEFYYRKLTPSVRKFAIMMSFFSIAIGDFFVAFIVAMINPIRQIVFLTFAIIQGVVIFWLGMKTFFISYDI